MSVADLSDVTVRAAVQEAAVEAIAEHLVPVAPGEVVDYVSGRSIRTCSPGVDCLPLAPALGLAPDVAGHLHRAVLTNEDDDSTEAERSAAPVDLRLLGALIEARVARDLNDICLAKVQHEVATLTVALSTSRLIGTAMGVLMATHRCTSPEAFAILQKVSQNQNRKLRDVAADVTYTGTVPGRTRQAG